VMASTLTERNADISLRALALGAKDYIPKPSTTRELTGAEAFKRELSAKVKAFGNTRRRRRGERLPAKRAFSVERSMPAPVALAPTSAPAIVLRPVGRELPQVIAIGSSTGGPQALFTLVQGLGRTVGVPVVLTQHMPATFTPILAEHITKLGGLPCAEARDGEPLVNGRIYLAPGDRHLLIEGAKGSMRARLTSDPPENFCRPSVDPMLRSATTVCEGRVLVTMLTGMGHDGLAGTRQVIEAGGTAIAQDEGTSVVWGMPGAVAQAGLCHAVLPLPHIAPKILDMLRMARP